MLKNNDEAVAFAKFLVWELKRHLDDIQMIRSKLRLLSKNFGVDIVANGKKWSVNGVDLTESEMWIGYDELNKGCECPQHVSRRSTRNKTEETTTP